MPTSGDTVISTPSTGGTVITPTPALALSLSKFFQSPLVLSPSSCALAILDPDTGTPLSYSQLCTGPDAAAWTQSASNEFGCLTQGILPDMPSGTNTMFFIPSSALPAGHIPTYLCIVTEEHPLKKETKWVQCTVSGDRIIYPGKVSTPTADLTTVKCLLNSVISTPGAHFMTADIKDFYLNNPLDRYEYMWIYLKDIPDAIIQQYNLLSLVHKNHVLVEIRKGMYGLPQAGIIANTHLVQHLATHGYQACTHTPGLFHHATRPVTFALVVDDFGIKYEGQDHADHLLAALRECYSITTDASSTKYCGLTLEWDYLSSPPTVDVSMPGYVAHALHHF